MTQNNGDESVGTTVVAFYTPGTYEREAELLEASLKRAGVKHELYKIPDEGSWDRNTARKAWFLRDRREGLRGPLLYVDVDAFVHEDVTPYFDDLARQRVDFGAHWFCGPAKGHDRTQVRPEGWWMLSGTLFLGDTIACRRLLRVWEGLNGACAAVGWNGGGQRNLWALVTAHASQLKSVRLPGRYCYVGDKPWAYPEGEPCLIEHTIASRENRGSVRRNPWRRKRTRELRMLVGL